MQTNAYDASIGRQAGATINMETRAGGKQYHHCTNAVVDQLEIEAVIAYGQRVLGSLGQLWQHGSFEDRLRFQEVVFLTVLSTQRTADLELRQAAQSSSLCTQCWSLMKVWRPRWDSNPCYRRERAVSWAGLDDRDAEMQLFDLSAIIER